MLLSAPVFWLVAAIVFGVTEALTMGLITIWFAGGALAALLASLLKLSVPIQLLIFIAVSVILLVATRKIFVEKLQTGQEKTNVEALIGKVGTVKREITPLAVGTVTLSGQEWSAVYPDDKKGIAVGEKVRVKAIEGVKLVVEPVND